LLSEIRVNFQRARRFFPLNPPFKSSFSFSVSPFFGHVRFFFKTRLRRIRRWMCYAGHCDPGRSPARRHLWFRGPYPSRFSPFWKSPKNGPRTFYFFSLLRPPPLLPISFSLTLELIKPIVLVVPLFPGSSSSVVFLSSRRALGRPPRPEYVDGVDCVAHFPFWSLPRVALK